MPKTCKINYWNTKNLPPPPINTYKTLNNDIDIKHLYDVLQEFKQFFNNKYMYTEHIILSRIIYRMKQKFRTAKDLKALEKVNKALENYFEMKVPSSIKKLMDLIPSQYKEETYLPTKNLLDYVLVRLQGTVKLMERIVESSKIAAYLLDKRMHTGHFWKIAFIIFALVSRVYVLAKYTTKTICEFYRKLSPFSHQLKNIGCEWLPPNYIFPKDLGEWMNVDWLEFDDEVQIIEISTEIPNIIQFFDLVNDEDDDVQFSDQYFLIDDEDDDDVEVLEEFKKICNTKTKSTYRDNLAELRGFDNREDIGEVIEINDSILDESSFFQNIENVINSTNINIVSDTDKSDVIAIEEDTLNSVLEENINLDSLVNFDDINESSKLNDSVLLKETVMYVSDNSLIESADKDETKSGANNTHINANSLIETQNNDSKMLAHNATNTIFITDSECELVVTDGGNNDTVSNISLIKISSIEEIKNKENNGKIENNAKLIQVENGSNEINIDSSLLANLNYEVDSTKINSNEANIVILSDTSVIETSYDQRVKIKKKREKQKKINGKVNHDYISLQSEGNTIKNIENTKNFMGDKNDTLVIESDEDVITLSDTSLSKTVEGKLVKQKKAKSKKFLKKLRNKKKSDSDFSLAISDSLHSNIIKKINKKNSSGFAEAFFRERKVIKRKKNKLRHITEGIRALENSLVKNKNNIQEYALQISSENHNFRNELGKENSFLGTPPIKISNKKLKEKNKLKKNKIVSSLGHQLLSENENRPHDRTSLFFNTREGHIRNNEINTKILKKNKHKLIKNDNCNNKGHKTFNTEIDDGAKNRHLETKINKLTKTTKNKKIRKRLQEKENIRGKTTEHKEDMATSTKNLVNHLDKNKSLNGLNEVKSQKKSVNEINIISHLQNTVRKKHKYDNPESQLANIRVESVFDNNSKKRKIDIHEKNEDINRRKKLKRQSKDFDKTQYIAKQKVENASNSVKLKKSNKRRKKKLKTLNKLALGDKHQKLSKFTNKFKKNKNFF